MQSDALVIIYVGVAASGKTTAAREAALRNHNAVIVSRDDIRSSHGWKHGEHEDRVTQIHQSQIEAGILNGREVHVADTNINKTFRNQLIKFCHQRGADVEIVTFPIALDVAILRDQFRDAKVGADVIRKQHDMLAGQELKDESLPVLSYESYTHGIGENYRPEAIVVDIDGTVAKHWNRSPYEYGKVGDDKPINDVISIVTALAQDYMVVFVSGRDDSCREETSMWITQHMGLIVGADAELHMRKSKDQRPDWVIKNEIYDAEVIPNYNIVMVFDDRDQVVHHLRRRGITVAQVNYGRF